MEGAYYSSISSGTPARWRNERTGNYGEVVVSPPVYVQRGPVCRDYTNTVYIGGRPEILRGQACRNADGSWSPV
jgi:surface antigen